MWIWICKPFFPWFAVLCSCFCFCLLSLPPHLSSLSVSLCFCLFFLQCFPFLLLFFSFLLFLFVILCTLPFYLFLHLLLFSVFTSLYVLLFLSFLPSSLSFLPTVYVFNLSSPSFLSLPHLMFLQFPLLIFSIWSFPSLFSLFMDKLWSLIFLPHIFVISFLFSVLFSPSFLVASSSVFHWADFLSYEKIDEPKVNCWISSLAKLFSYLEMYLRGNNWKQDRGVTVHYFWKVYLSVVGI